jgi:hypothetical protein
MLSPQFVPNATQPVSGIPLLYVIFPVSICDFPVSMAWNSHDTIACEAYLAVIAVWGTTWGTKGVQRQR